MTGEAARQAFLAWLAEERRASPLTVLEYGRDVADFLGFLVRHVGSEPSLATLAALTQADFRAWLSEGAGKGHINATRARHLAAVRSFYRYLARRHGTNNPAASLLRTPKLQPGVPKALTASDALEPGRRHRRGSRRPGGAGARSGAVHPALRRRLAHRRGASASTSATCQRPTPPCA